jgi:UDP-N-acetylglucosamine acyltransferase
LPTIHPTASIDRHAELAESVEIGPYCNIAGRVAIGDGTRLIANVTIQGPASIGARNLIYPYTCLGYAPQDRTFDPREQGAGLVIGDDNVFREFVTVNRAKLDCPTRLGSRNYWMANSHAGHDCLVGDDCTFANGVLLAGHVAVGDKAFFGGNSGIHQFCRVGRLGMLAGTESGTQDVPPFCTMIARNRIGALNLVGLRRAGYRRHIKELQEAFEILFTQGHTNQVAVTLIEQQFGDDPLCMELAQFVKQSKRGICPYVDA